MLLMRIGRNGALALASLLVAATAIYAAGWIRYSNSGPSARLGIQYEYMGRAGELLVTHVYPGSPAAAAGLRSGDRLLAIDGAPLSTLGPLYDSVNRGQPGRPVVLGVTREGSARRDVEAILGAPETSAEASSVRMLANLLLRLYPVGFLVVMAVLLLQRPRDRDVWLVSLLFAGFIAAAPLDPAYAHPGLRRFALVYATIFRALIPPLFYALFAVFPARSPIDQRVPWLKTWLIAAALIVALPIAVSVGVAGTWDPLTRWNGLRAARLAGMAVGLLALVAFAAGVASLIWSYRAAPGPAKRRSRVIVWGTVASVSPMAVLQVLARGGDVYQFPFWIWAPSVFALFLLPLTFAYAVIRYRVIEIPLLIKRSARYLLVQRGFILLVAALGLGASIALALWFPRVASTRPEWAIPAGLLVGVAFGIALAWGATRVHRGIASRIDRAFFRSAYDARRILEDLAAQAAGATNREQLAQLLGDCLNDALKPLVIAVYVERSDGVLRAAAGTVSAELETLDVREASLQALAAHAEPFVVEPSGEDHPLPPLAPLGPECVVPMIGRTGMFTGLLVLGSRLSDEPYSSEDRRLLASVCRQAGVALEAMILAEQMAGRLEAERSAARELSIAQEVQARLLPQEMPTIRSLDVRAACLQARAVGGDYYDFLDFGDGRHAVVLADISGKGISAALLMANLQAHLRAHYLTAREDPAALLTGVDRYMYDTTAAHHYATLFFGRYDDGSGRFDYVNCGHNPPLLLRRARGVEWLAPTAPAVGLLPAWSCTVGGVTLEPGDTLVLYSDGVTEAMDDEGECFGEERLLALAERSSGLSVDGLMAALIEEVRRFSGAVQEDDLTLIVARAR